MTKAWSAENSWRADWPQRPRHDESFILPDILLGEADYRAVRRPEASGNTTPTQPGENSTDGNR